MSSTIKIVGFTGSLREQSYNSDDHLTDEATRQQIQRLLEALLDEVKTREYALVS